MIIQDLYILREIIILRTKSILWNYLREEISEDINWIQMVVSTMI